MADKGRTPTVLDSEWLKRFIHENIDEFRATLQKILKDDPNGRAISFIADAMLTSTTLVATKPLALGLMAGEKGVGGGDLNKAIQETAASIVKILTDQNLLWEEVEDALRETIQRMRERQGKSLQKISTETFLDLFEDVDTAVSSDMPAKDA
ncbi:type VII secretion system-associated protein [Streptomyces sp. NBC_01233]|uniref:type VII secretion system-associated protein n=1 Tax=Streptomyces sp. NBC_01233 TaxID=2903787 RepID=UPI002E10CCFE|nr:type VII secretion system-associated protein [Streptomyces sp. NBC_01233]WSP92936.1 type VII secretion system-associated protein [Streptomyces sp. NBC_01233]